MLMATVPRTMRYSLPVLINNIYICKNMRFVREGVVDLVVAHDDVKIGFAISDEVIYVLIYFIYFFISMVSCWKIILNYIHR